MREKGKKARPFCHIGKKHKERRAAIEPGGEKKKRGASVVTKGKKGEGVSLTSGDEKSPARARR